MTPQNIVDFIKSLDKSEIWKFYKLPEWQALRAEILAEQHNECQVCKAKGKYTPADTVHHIQYVRKHPETALDKTYEYKGNTYVNLIAICKACHNEVHTEKLANKRNSAIMLNEERW